jgi:hypothetical protein
MHHMQIAMLRHQIMKPVRQFQSCHFGLPGVFVEGETWT